MRCAKPPPLRRGADRVRWPTAPTLLEEVLDPLLGPWGVAIGAAAVGIGLVTRRRSGPGRGSRPSFPDARTLAASGVGLVGWWREVYAEARTEWEAERPSAATASNPP